MRAAPIALCLGLAALLAAPVAAQDSGSQDKPIPWVIGLDEDGFDGAPDANFTEGDWVRVDITNLDSVPHRVTVPGLGIDVTVQPFGEETRLVQATPVGTYEVHDDRTGDVGIVQVIDADVPSYEAGAVDESGQPVAATGTSSSPGIPALELGLVAGVLAAAVALVRKS